MRAAACLVLTVAALTGTGTPAAAQRPTPPDTTKTREEQIRDRLRNLGPLIRRDTLGADSAAADSAAQARERPGMFTDPRAAATGGGALTGVQRDSVMQQLLLLPGFTATEYKGESVRFDADSGRLDLRRGAEVLEAGQLLRADSSLVFWERRNLACAYGNPEVSGVNTTAPITGDSLCYNTATGLGFVKGASTTVSEGADWRIRGDFWFFEDTGYGHDALFTDCELDEPHYHFAAREMKVVRGNVIVARNVTMKFADVPVFWLPFFVQSLSTGRRSGLLMPRFSVNDVVRNSARYNRRIYDVGFYWAMNDYMGAEMSLDWYSNNWTALQGSLDYRILDRFLAGGLTYRKFWEDAGGSNFTLSTRNSWEPDERTSMRLSANYATSSRFVRQSSFDPRELNRSIDSNLGVSRRFGWGTVNLTGSRNQYLTDNAVTMVLPSVGVNLSSVTLFPALPGETRFYSNATWTGGVDARVESRSIGDSPRSTAQDQRNVTSRMDSRFTMGNFSWAQGFNYADRRLERREFGVDTIPDLPGRGEERMDWNTSLNYTQRLIGTSTFTPGLRLRGEMLRGDTTGGATVAAPTRVDFNASLQTALFGFWPGIGPVERLRHRLSPSLSYSYSPEPTVTDRQKQFFPATQIAEQNRISFGVNQTFEARLRARQGAAQADTVVPDTMRQDTTTPGAPRRIQRDQPMTLLALTTDAVVYDFVQAKQGLGIQTTQISNSIQSDLVRGLQLSISHDLFRPLPPPEDGGNGPVAVRSREFAPHLSQVSASFSLDNDSGLLRRLGLAGRQREEPQRRDAAPDTVGAGMEDPTLAGRGDDFGLIGRERRGMGQAPRAPVGTWRASFNYTLLRPRPVAGGAGGFDSGENQQLNAQMSFQPTENWSLNWNTGYSFTRGDFTDHILTLTRRLHDWDANFDFVKAQNGNFSFQFRVALRANPDIKVDYEQRDRTVTQRQF